MKRKHLLQGLLCSFLVVGLMSDVVAQEFTASLTVTGNDGTAQTLQWGTVNGATDAYEDNVDQYAPPVPPRLNVMDARFRVANEDYYKDMRAPIGQSDIIWTLLFQGRAPFTVTWDASQLPNEGSFRLRGVGDIDVDMRTQNSYSVPLGVSRLRIEYFLFSTVIIKLQEGWNLVGLPLTLDDAGVGTLFPNRVPNTLFAYQDRSYDGRNSLSTCVGYWSRNTVNEEIQVQGREVTRCEQTLIEGWNLLSTPNCAFPVDQIQDPDNLLIPNTIFGYDGSYAAPNILEAGSGYWVRAIGPGNVILDCANTAAASKSGDESLMEDIARIEGFHHLRVSDAEINSQDLYFGHTLPASYHPLSFSLPPRSPRGSFDARLAGGVWASEASVADVQVQPASYPLKLTWLDTAGTLVVEEIRSDAQVSEVRNLQAGATLEIHDVAVTGFRVRVVPGMNEGEVPEGYALEANYPNPFNPETIIRFTLPEEAHVMLTIHTVLGEEIEQLAQGAYPAGTYTVQFDATNLASGLYYYTLHTGTFSATRTMVLMK